MAEALIEVEVAYALPDRQHLISLQLPAGSTAAEAIRRSGLLLLQPELELTRLAIGIWSKSCPLDTPLRQDDRVEIYRPLQVDPKEARRRRAALKQQRG